MGPFILLGKCLVLNFGGLTFKNRGQLGSRYLLFYPIKINHSLIGIYTIHGSYGKQTVLFTFGRNVGKYTIPRPMDGSPIGF